MEVLKDYALKIEEQLIEWRRHLHRYPECSFQEKETSAFVKKQLESIPGMTVFESNVGYGVVGTLSNGVGPTIALRADMDALPIKEEADVSFSSEHPGVMHACGHDAHTAILLGAATLLAEQFNHKSRTGTIKFVFQPAEESTDETNTSGGLYLVKEGVYDDVDMAFALHMCPWLTPDAIQVYKGPAMGSLDVFKGTIKGTGGHGAYPHLGTDPVWLLSQILPTLYSLQSRFISPLDAAVLSIGIIQGGRANNVIPSEVYVEGTVRCYSAATRNDLIEEIKKAFTLANVFGGEGTCLIDSGEPALVNNDEAVDVIVETAKKLYPDDRIVEAPYGMGSEDFAHTAEKTRSAMFFLGCKPEHGQYDLHTPLFQIDEACLKKGATLLASMALAALQGGIDNEA
ncbi:N-acetyl-L,L-diaminopimelate deacetylase [Bacillus sp. JCM 19047]|uniref:M20 metallopeptidase family protein n=1 Tax=Shouchella miscanthi TaxID=2598861 RepID=UPI0003EFFCCD|nr:amidohydrolase [Shouchella miscanthi]GAF23876.1 N-acetyl-L,L-diaminopimelate deacetylase [Bacillus sp. JCM 19047]